MSFLNLDTGGGGQHWIFEVAMRLRARNEVSIITTNQGVRQGNLVGLLGTSGIEVHEIESYPRPLSFLRPKGLAKLEMFFLKSDIVYFVYWAGGLELSTLAMQEITRTPVIAGYHTPIDWYRHAQASTRLQRVYYGILGDGALRAGRYFAAHHVQADETREVLGKWKARNIFKISSARDIHSFVPAHKYGEFTVLFLGRLETQKGVDDLPNIYYDLRDRISNFRLLVAGDGSLNTIVKRLESNHNVKWLGYVTEDEKRLLLARSHVLLAPSRYETFMGTCIEAMASGTPVVVSNVGGVREYMLDGSNGYITNGVGEMVDRIVDIHSMWKMTNGYSEMCEEARRTAVKFDWDVMIPRFEEMLQSVRSSWRG